MSKDEVSTSKKRPMSTGVLVGCIIVPIVLVGIIAIAFVIIVIVAGIKANTTTTTPTNTTPTTDSHGYTTEYRNSYTESCINSATTGSTQMSQAKATKYCSCTLEYTEAHYSYSEAVKISQDVANNKDLPQGMIDAASYCVKQQ